MIAAILACLLPWGIVGFCCRLLYRLLIQQNTLLDRLKAIEQQQVQIRGLIQRRRQADNLARFALEQQMQQAPAPKGPSGLPAGSAAPDFDLPDLAGQRHQLEEFRGRKVLLVFFNPGCGYCTQMAPELAQLRLDGQTVPVVVTTGSSEANSKLVAEHKLRCPMLLDEKGEVGVRYQMSGTPTGYLIDEKGVIASPLAVGSRELLSLLTTHGPPPVGLAKGKENKGLTASRITRDGLKAGTPAPSFRLTKIGGGEIALERLRGMRVLLVLSDPECGPCNALAPKLEELHRQRPDVLVLMISRRDEEANRKKMAEHGLTFPVLLQKQWEISRSYGIFSTPVGYLIDVDGVIERDVAVGVEPILKLLSAPKTVRPLAA